MRVWLPLAVVAVLLAGCSAPADYVPDPDPDMPTPPAGFESDYQQLFDQISPPSPEPTFDDAGVLGFTRTYLEATNWAYATGDISFLEAYCDPGNEHCTVVQTTGTVVVDEQLVAYGMRSYIAVSGNTVVISAPTETGRQIEVSVINDPGEFVAADGQITEIEGSQARMVFEMEWRGSHWVMLAASEVAG
ncbi:MAG: hypothetical protein ACK5H2_02730 [Beutenbergiaceae bacterium]